MYQCMCETVALGPCRECSAAALPQVIDLRTSRIEARPDLLAIHDRLIEAGRGFAEHGLGGIVPSAQVPRERLNRRRKLVSDVVPGWTLCTESSQGSLDKQIVLLGSGEIFSDGGEPQLTREHLTDRHWAIAEWFTGAINKYGLNGWPAGIEDPRQLAVEFHTTAATEPPANSGTAEAFPRRRWRNGTRRVR